MHLKFIIRIVLVLVLSCPATFAQEALATILERGFPAQWYVVGPFESDLDEGVVEAIRNARSPLGRNDFMASQGGIARVLPKHGLEILKESGTVNWLKTRGTSNTVDLSPFFAEVEEGIAYAAFYANSPVEQVVLFELQSILGVRVFLNGKEIKDLPAAPLTVSGVDFFQADFQQGTNLVVFQVPGASFAALAKAFGMPEEQFRHQQFSNRSHLLLANGYELDVRMTPMATFEGISYAKLLKSTGTFSGSNKGLFQDAWLTLYNPNDEPSPVISYTANVIGSSPRIEVLIPSIPPRSVHTAHIALPISSRLPGKGIRVDSALVVNRKTALWTSSVVAGTPPTAAYHHVVAVPSMLDASVTSQGDRTEQYREELASRIQRNRENDEYGFSLGTVDQWLPVLSAYPEYRSALKPLLKTRAVSPWGMYAPIDHRSVGGETIVRNLLYGDLYARTWLDTPSQVYWGWNLPALSPQLPQLLEGMQQDGVIHNLSLQGLPALYRGLGRDGSTILARRKTNSPLPKTLLDIHQIAWRQHPQWEAEGLENDVQIYENTAHAPETFWLDKNIPLKKALPSIKVRGDGVAEYLQALQSEFAFMQRRTTWSSRDTRGNDSLEVLRNPELHRKHAQAERSLLDAEMWATFASLGGAQYPFNSFNHGWKQLLTLSHPERLGKKPSTHNYLDQLQQYRNLDAVTRPVLENSLSFLASKISTQSADTPTVPGTQAIVVYNSSNWVRDDYVEIHLELEEAEGLTIVDSGGLSIPFEFSALHIINERLKAITVRFLATDVPSVGYTTYYAIPKGTLVYPEALFTPYIENEFFQLAFENGEISRITDRSGELPELKDAVFNDIVAYRLHGDVHHPTWNGDIVRASDQSSTVKLEKISLGQRATITTPFLGGELIRRVTLYDGLPRIEFDIELKDIESGPMLFGATFSPINAALAPLVGHQFGSMFGGADTTTEAFKALPDSNALPVLNTATRFHAITIAPHITVEGDIFEALRPTTIIHADFDAQDKMAKELQRALILRGIPSITMPQEFPVSSALWRDDTLPAGIHDDLGQETFFRILIGHPKHNRVTEALLGQFQEATRNVIKGLIDRNQAVFLYDNHVPFGHAPLPTLLLAGDTVESTRSMVNDVIEELKLSGSIALSKEQYLPAEGVKKPTWGGAILHKGVALNAVQHDTWMHFFYSTSGGASETLSRSTTVEFALYPYSGMHNSSDVTRQSHVYSAPFNATQTSVKAGTLASRGSFLQVPEDNYILTSVAPRVPEETLFSMTQPYLDAVIVRGYETKGYDKSLTLKLSSKVYGIAKVNALNHELSPVRTVSGDPVIELRPYEISSTALYPTPGKRMSQPPVLSAESSATVPVFSRSWLSNAGENAGEHQALTVRIQDPIPTPAGQVKIHIVNNSSHQSFSGELATRVSRGWLVTPETQSYSLAPNSETTLTVSVTQQNRELMQWGIMAQVKQQGSTILDVATNYDYPYEVVGENQGKQYLITIRNQGGLPLVGTAELITQLDTEPSGSSGTITPRTGSFQIAPYQESRVLFTNNSRMIPDWVYVKVFANNEVQYLKVELVKPSTESASRN